MIIAINKENDNLFVIWLSPSRRKDLMDNLLEMMEKHTTNLETVVEERTHEISMEKQRIDRLLYNMMPA